MQRSQLRLPPPSPPRRRGLYLLGPGDAQGLHPGQDPADPDGAGLRRLRQDPPGQGHRGHEHEHHHDHEHEHEHDHEHDHEHHHDHDHEHGHECSDPNCACHHHHHHADEVFTSWGRETPKAFTQAKIQQILTALDSGDYGKILRAKGIVAGENGAWIEFDYVPEEHEVREGHPDYTGRLCVIGAELKEAALAELFGL